MWSNPYPRGAGFGLRDAQGGTDLTAAALQEKVNARDNRSAYLWEFGEPFWLQVALAIGTTPAAGTQFVRQTTAVDFDLLLVGAHSNLLLSALTIQDLSRQRLITNSATLISSLATFTNATGTVTMDRAYWHRPYFLPARAQLQLTVTADGTESGGYFIFLALMPPNYSV